MKRSQIILAIAALLVVGLLFMLPKVIVSKDEKGSLAEAAGTTTATDAGSEGHLATDPAQEAAHITASPEALSALATLRKQYAQAGSDAQRLSLADTLAGAYKAAGRHDSAGMYYEQVATARPTEQGYKKAADQYYQAYSFAANQQRQEMLGNKTRELYEQVLKKNPDNLEAKSNLAMTYVASATPMKGITMLREVLEQDPNNQEALYRMGMLAIQSNQYERAIERFRKLTEVNPKHVNGTFYLGVSLAETGKKQEATEVFKRVQKMSNDPELQNSVEEYLQRLNS